MMKRTILSAILMTLTTIACADAQAGDKAEVKGNLSKEQIRDVVRSHIDEVRYCYNQVLEVDPTVSAKVVIDFTIGEKGTVTRSAVAESNGPEQLGNCMSAAFRSWQFPAPNGGVVEVSYPFVMEPG
jgi:TonB family protein